MGFGIEIVDIGDTDTLVCSESCLVVYAGEDSADEEWRSVFEPVVMQIANTHHHYGLVMIVGLSYVS